MHRDCRKPFSRGLSLWGRRYKTDPVIAVCAIYQSIIRRREGICQGLRGTLIGNLQAPPCSIPSVIAKKKTAANLRLVAAPFVVPLTGIYPRAKKPAAGSFFTHCGAPPCSIPSVIAKKENIHQPAAGGCSLCGAADGNRTRTVLPPRDFKSLASACSATAA